MQKNIVACVTAQISCEKIISAALDLSKKLNCNLTVVTVQKAKEDAKIRANSLKILNTLSKITGCNIDIVYGDNPKNALVSYIHKLSPQHIFIGNPDPNTSFYKEFISALPWPISVVNETTVYTIPASVTGDEILNFLRNNYLTV